MKTTKLTAIPGIDEKFRLVAGEKVVCCLGLVATMYFTGEIADKRARAIAAYERYAKAIGDRLVWGADPKNGRPRKIAGTDLGDVGSWSKRVALADDFSFVFHGGQKKDDADPYSITGLVRPDRPQMDYLTFSLPFAWVEQDPFDALVRLVTDVATILRPEHGYAGLGVIKYVNQSSHAGEMEAIVGLARRFRGLEIDFPGSHAIYLTPRHAIKGVNWLTILGSSWVDRVGGKDHLRSVLPAEILLHDYPGGLIVQAGPEPLFGDVNRSEPMPAYGHVARALKPVRTTFLDSIAWTFGMDEEATTEWLDRFDREAP
jgi:Protein of unknown function (DUF3396)